jgi:hypothetical protein
VSVIFPTEGNLFMLEGHKTVVGNGGAMGIGRQSSKDLAI